MGINMVKHKAYLVSALVLTAFLLSACGDTVKERVIYGKVIPKAKSAEAAEWVRSVMEAAYREGHNGGELEDPEKVVKEAKRAAFELFGELTIGIEIENWSFGDYARRQFVPYEECSDRQKAMCDAFREKGAPH